MYRFSKHNLIVAAITVAFTIVSIFAVVPMSHAHEFWVVPVSYGDGVLKSNIGYGHSFPNCEPIPADRVHIFAPLQIVTSDGAITLDQVEENYKYQKKMPLKKGSYPVIGTYRPTFWSNGPTGWEQKDRKQRPDAAYVQEAIMCAKAILNVQGAADNEFVTKPSGQRLEIVPLVNPAKAKAGGKLEVKVLCDGKPAKGVMVMATYDSHADKKNPAFEGKANADGMVVITPLRPGFWLVKAKHAYEHPDKARADEVVLVSTFAFQI